MAVYLYLQGVLCVFSVCALFILGLDVCEDKITDCQPCNLQYPVPSPTRENCMKTCQVCTDFGNVALNKTANQVSVQYGGVASNAVDGRITGDNRYGNFCTHTDESKPAGTSTHWWCVDLRKMYNINNVTIYNIVTKWDFRLQGFQLNTAPNGQCNQQGFDRSTPCYRDTPDRIVHIYTVEKCNLQSNKSISAGTIFIWHRRFVALTLCEVQAYVGISCSYGYYSTSSSTCEPCDGCSDNKCNPDTGDCIGVCKSGFYGTKCNKYCSQGCSTPDCKRDGSCTVCKPGWYGDNCESRCPTGCKETCNKTSGACDECKEGTVGLYCNSSCIDECRPIEKAGMKPSTCVRGLYGDVCTRKCSQLCRQRECQQETGTCIFGCIGGGKIADCSSDDSEGGNEASISPVGVGIIGVFVGGVVFGVAVGVIVYICMKRRSYTDQEQTTEENVPPLEEQVSNSTESTNYYSTANSHSTHYQNQSYHENKYDSLKHVNDNHNKD